MPPKAREVCTICPLVISLRKDGCSVGMGRFLSFFFNIQVVVFSVYRQQDPRNMSSLAQTSSRQQGIQERAKDQIKLAERKRSLSVRWDTCTLLRLWGSSHLRQRNTETSTTGLLSLQLSCHPELAYTSELCFRPFAPSEQDAKPPHPQSHKPTGKLLHV